MPCSNKRFVSEIIGVKSQTVILVVNRLAHAKLFYFIQTFVCKHGLNYIVESCEHSMLYVSCLSDFKITVEGNNTQMWLKSRCPSSPLALKHSMYLWICELLWGCERSLKSPHTYASWSVHKCNLLLARFRACVHMHLTCMHKKFLYQKIISVMLMVKIYMSNVNVFVVCNVCLCNVILNVFKWLVV